MTENVGNENIGEMRCHICGKLETAFIRKKKKGGGNYPLYLWHQKTGPQFYNKPEGQDWILSDGILYDENGELPAAKIEPVEIDQGEEAEQVETETVEEEAAPVVETEQVEEETDSEWLL